MTDRPDDLDQDTARELTALFAAAREDLPAEPFQATVLAEADAAARGRQVRRRWALVALVAFAVLAQGVLGDLAAMLMRPLVAAAPTGTLFAPLNSVAGLLLLVALVLRPVWRRLL